MWSSSPVCARPVRTLDKSTLKASTLLCIFCSVFLRSSASIGPSPSDVYQRALVLADDHAQQRVFPEDAEHVDRQLLVAAQRQRGGVHHLQVALDGLVERQAPVALRRGVLLRVGGVDAVHLGAL